MKTTISILLACIVMATLATTPVCHAKTNHPVVFDSGPGSKHSLTTSASLNVTNYATPVTQLRDQFFKHFKIDTTMMTSHYIVGEKPSGTLNGSNKVFTLAHSPLTGKDAVYLNGVLQVRGANYTISGSTITFIIAPFAGDLIRVIYYY